MSIDTSRRGFMALTGASAIAAPALKAAAAPVPLVVENLQADCLTEPRALHSQKVRLSWTLRADRRGMAQKAYRIGVASTPERARAARFDLWDSGKIESRQSLDIPYGGAALPSRARCFWAVTVWDDQDHSATSPLASWEMGLLSPQDWQGGWIAAETATLRDDRLAGLRWMRAADGTNKDARSFRLSFDLPEAAQLIIYSCANRPSEAMLDEAPLAVRQDAMRFGPPQTDRNLRQVQAGGHHLGLTLKADANAAANAPAPHVALLIRATLASGKVLHITGAQLRTAAGKPDDWGKPAADTSHWSPAIPDEGAAPFPGNGAFLLRHPFTAARAIRSARLYVAAMGAYVPWLNGQKVGDALLAPEWTDFSKHVLYRAYDVTGLVKPGANVLGAMVGDGWYGSYMAPAGRYGFGGAPLRLRAQLEIAYTDGGTEVIASDQGWSVSPSSILSCDLYDGEVVDGRLDQPGWSATAFHADQRWESAQPVETPQVALIGSALQPIASSLSLRPKVLTPRGTGSVVVDFGQNFAGWVKLKTKGETGRNITLRFAELLRPDGDVDQSNLRSARATDSWTMRGDPAGETFEPHFTYHGFRYVQIDGLAAPLGPGDVEGIVIHSSLPETGTLSLPQYVPQRMWQNGLWSQRSNFMGIPTDCPQRDERLGWMGDAHVFWDAACFNMDAAAFTRKFMRDVRDAQRSDGSFPDIAPNNDLEHFTPTGSSPGWADAGVFLPWTSWRRYGDTSVIDEHWEAMERFLASLHTANPDLLWTNGRGNDFGDWLALDAKQPGDPTTPKDLIGTAFWKASADAMADMAQATGRAEAAERYRGLSGAIMQAFVRAYVQADGHVGNGSQTGYILALNFNLLPQALRKPAADLLVADIARRGTLLSTGFLGTPYSLDVLADAGHGALVHDLLLRTAYPSWGYMIDKHATTIWERWNGDAGDLSMNSYNHYALGAVAGFMFRRIAGIDPVEPGFARFRFDPVYDPRMPSGGARYQSRSGLIVTDWKRGSDGSFTLDLTVPANTRCTLHLPARGAAQVSESARPVAGRAEFKPVAQGDRLVLDVGSGVYHFRIARAVFA
ncbi:alpha-L-rhamnosidase [Novosphingobium rosa]|uniref:alpha-L-rhamnosidase n=1 Tax=Novosphingobium rosa TaxID=76978 RepID=UPI000A59A57D|nr:alpha-L-rhamnosidase [Novosphingobium rosa]